MEDYIYILIGVIWLAASVYRASQKKKQAAARKSAGEPAKAKPEMSDTRSLLEELLGGQEIKIPEPEEQEISIPEPEKVIVEEDPPLRKFESEYTKMGLKGVESLMREGTSSTGRILFKDTFKSTQKKEAGQTKINLRKAIIYKAILERPYT
jgi:hypothetical protein